MIFKFKKDGMKGISDFIKYISNLKDGNWIAEIKKKQNIRTSQQNRALHLWFTTLSEEFNKIGVPLYVSIGNRMGIDREWTMQAVKDFIFRPVMTSLTKKKSTTKLTRIELDQCLKPIQKWISEDYEIEATFPSEEELRKQSLVE